MPRWYLFVADPTDAAAALRGENCCTKKKKEEKEKEKEEEGKGHQDQDAGENTEAIQVELDESTDSIAASDIDHREYDPTEGLYVVADLLFPMPPRRKSIGATGVFAWEVPLGCCRCTTHEYH